MRVTVLGAGIFGTTGALELARRGHQVTLLDPGPVPHPDAASTDISKVVRLDYGGDAFYTELMERALPGWRELNERCARPLFHETGFAILASEAMVPGGFERDSFDLLTGRGHALERLDRSAIAERFPAWSERFVDGYFNPNGGWAESGEVVKRYLAEAREQGVDVCVGRGEAEDPDADLVVVAAGAWTQFIVPELAGAMRVVGQPVKHFGPADASPFRPPAFVPWAADIGRTGWYGFCANADGIVKVANHGPGVETDPRGARVVGSDAEEMFRAFLEESIPSLAEAPQVGERLCLYCDTFDGDLWIGRHPERDRLMVAAGGSGHGFKFAPILGELIADEAEGKTAVPIAERIGWRAAKEQRFEDARFDGSGNTA